jgi:rubrerythrin
MKLKLFFVASVLTIASFSIGHIAAQNEKKMNEQTLQNLSTAMHGEAFAYAKYLLYAEQARRSRQPELADLLEKTAKTERFEHFAEEAKLAGVVGSNSANLRDAIKGESYESETMYREFAQQAEQAGDHQAAQRFEEIRKDEAKHRDAFNAALSDLEKNSHPGNR